MIDELRDLYEQVIRDHDNHPRNFRAMPDAWRSALGHNRLCGDKLELFIKLRDDRIEDASFQGKGCAISTASASMMTEAIKGKTLAEAHEMFEAFHRVVTSPPDQQSADQSLGKLAVFTGVREFPVRVKCATLPWHTLESVLAQRDEPVSTE